MNEFNISQIHPKAFAHPVDKVTTAALEKVPILPDLLKKVAELNAEEKYRAYHMYNSVQLGPRQLPSLWRMVNEVAERFGMPAPTTYVSREGGINAFAFGLRNHSIILTTGLVDMMSDAELEAIIGHELAHILCEHMLYRNVGLTLAIGAVSPLPSLVPAKFLAQSVTRLLYSWNRAAEYSADRAALLVLRDPEAMASCLARIAGVPNRFLKEFDPQVFQDQATDYQEQASLWSKLVTWDLSSFRTHPEPVRRAAAISKWYATEEYQKILAGHYVTRLEVEMGNRIEIEGVSSCPLCWSPVGEQPQCPHCGLIQDPARQQLCQNGHVNSWNWKFCKMCGIRLREEPVTSRVSVGSSM